MSIEIPSNSPGYYSPEYRAMEPGWSLVRRIRNVNESIRETLRVPADGPATCGITLLPKAEAEGMASYAARVAMTFAFTATDETVHGMVGLALRHDPVLEEDVPERLIVEWEDVDGQGTHGAVFAQRALDHALTDGHHAILTDYPAAVPGLRADEEVRQGRRAYLVSVTIDRITAWRFGQVQGRVGLTMVKLSEHETIDDGTFGSKTVRQFRTFYQDTKPDGTPFVRFTVDQEQGRGNSVTYVSVGRGELVGPKFIPLRVHYGGEQTGNLQSRPPLRGLAWSNLDHAQTGSLHAYSLYKTCVAVPVLIGRTDTTAAVELNSDVCLDVGIGGDAKFMQGAGTALQPLVDKLEAIERRMGSQGFTMVRKEPGSSKQTLGEKQIETAREESKLARALRSLNDALEGALDDMAAFYGLDSGGSITTDADFSDTFLTPQEMDSLIALEEAGKLTLKTMLLQLQAGGRVLQGVDIEAEVKLVEEQQANEPILPAVTARGTPILQTVPEAPAIIAS